MCFPLLLLCRKNSKSRTLLPVPEGQRMSFSSLRGSSPNAGKGQVVYVGCVCSLDVNEPGFSCKEEWRTGKKPHLHCWEKLDVQ